MAVQVSKSGGIYIEISGDYSKLQADLREAGVIGKAMGQDISNALSSALAPKEVANVSANLNKYFSTARRAAQATTADLSSMDKQFREMGKAIGVTEKDLGRFANAHKQAFQAQSQKAFLDNLKGIQRLTGESDEAMNRLAKSLGGVGNEFNKASSGIKVFGVELGTALKGAAVALLAKKAAELAKESFDLAARYETLGVVVQQVGKVAGYSAVQVDENVNALRRMGIAGIEARKTLTQLIQAQVSLSKTPGLARVAQDAAVIGGINSSDAFEKMVHGIQSAQTQVLRTIGINVNFEKSYAKLAAQLGKATDELTEQEKVQARVNAVTEAGEKIAGSYEAAMTTLGKQTSSLSRVYQDLETDLGKFALEAAKTTGGIKGFTAVLEGWNAAALAMRGNMAGLSLGEMTDVSRSGGLQAFRELVEGIEEARDSTERFEAQLAATASKLNETDTAFLRDQLATLKKQFDDGVISVNTYRRAVNELMVVLRAGLTAPAFDAPMTDEDLTGAKKALDDLRVSYSKTSAAMKQAKIDALNANIASVESMRKTLGNDADKMLKAFQDEKDKLTKGSRDATKKADRVSYQAHEAAEAAADALKTLQVRYAEVVAQVQGNSLGAAFLKNARELEAQMGAIAKKERDIEENQAKWGKEGRLTEEVSRYLAEQQKSLDEEKELYKQIKASNDLLAVRADLARVGIDDGSRRNDMAARVDTLNRALAEGRVTAEQYQIRMNNIGLEIAKLNQSEGLSTFTEDVNLALAKITEGYEGVAAGLTNAFGDFFQSFSQGFADSIGRAVVESENLGEALYNVANSAISSLISALVQLGIQWAITQIGMSTAAQAASKATATSVAADNATILSTAAPAAAAESVATFGSAAVVGAAALAGVFGMLIGMMMGGFKTGGYTGNAGKDEVTGVVHGGEYVFNADAVRRIGLSQLEAMQRGSVGTNPSSGNASVAAFGGVSNPSGSMPTLNVSIENYGTSKAFEVEQLSESEIRIIARDEAREVTREYAPKVIASNIGNPNSAVSKSLGKNTKAERRR